MTKRVFVSGVGMSKFRRPSEGFTYLQLSEDALNETFSDAGISYSDVEQAYAGYVYGDSTCGQRVLYQLGCTGIPIVNVNNNCASGSSALFLARQAVASGAVDCALALGFEQMVPGALRGYFEEWPQPMEYHFTKMVDMQGFDKTAPGAAQMFGGAGREYAEKYGVSKETFAKITVKARQHARNNPNAVFRDILTLEEVLGSPMQFDPLTRYQCCPPTSGAGAALICSEDFVRKKGIRNSVEIAAQSLSTDFPVLYEKERMMEVCGYEMTKNCTQKVIEEAGIGINEVDVVELHDCFTANELITYDALGLVATGEAEKLVEDKDNTYGGKFVVNPSGGLLSKGHPLGATGLAQCAEIVWQLRGQAEDRQVEGARIGLQHNLGLGGACVVTMYVKN